MNRYTPLLVGYLSLIPCAVAKPVKLLETSERCVTNVADLNCLNNLSEMIKKYDGSFDGHKDGCYTTKEIISGRIIPYLPVANTDAEAQAASHYISLMTQGIENEVVAPFDINHDGKICDNKSIVSDDINNDNMITIEDFLLYQKK